MFIDHAAIHVKAGRGGRGCISFRREKYVPRGGPDGGNGGNGGNVVIRAERNMTTLMDFRYKRNYQAENGEHGKGANKTGKSGGDIVLNVPCGTIVRDADTKEIVADLIDHRKEVIVARGGKGGRGNAEFATSTNQAPRVAEPGTDGEERTIELELKLLADVGLVGFPNAGKSTLISRISAARPKIADYPFTTLAPNLGIVRYGEYKSFVVADLPGLIEGAHRGKGLGIQFLRHIERTRLIVYLIECISTDPKNDYKTLVNELKSFKKEMLRRPQIVAVTKMDLADDALRQRLKKISFGKKIPVHFISAVSSEGIKELINRMWKALQKRNSPSSPLYKRGDVEDRGVQLR
jgi:GTP-binding protein